MDTEKAEALEKSIEKWRGIVAGEESDGLFTNCALCALYSHRKDEDKQCEGCPVKDKTKVHGCISSPWSDWNAHLAHHGIGSTLAFNSKRVIQPNCPECVRLAKAELGFLISLREKPKYEFDIHEASKYHPFKGWFYIGDQSNSADYEYTYLRKDGTVGGCIPSLQAGYWSSREEAQVFLDNWEKENAN